MLTGSSSESPPPCPGIRTESRRQKAECGSWRAVSRWHDGGEPKIQIQNPKFKIQNLKIPLGKDFVSLAIPHAKRFHAACSLLFRGNGLLIAEVNRVESGHAHDTSFLRGQEALLGEGRNPSPDPRPDEVHWDRGPPSPRGGIGARVRTICIVPVPFPSREAGHGE
jgi:hypothetical protein